MTFRLPEMLLLGLLAIPAAAQQRSEIVLRADSASIDQKAGTGVYQGNAEMTQGLRHLSAEVIYIRLKNDEISRVEAEGDPVRLTEGDTLNARAQRLVYDIGEEQIYLFEEAFVDHQGRTFEGARVRYDLQTRQVEASGEGKDRVRLVIPAEKKQNGDKPGADASPEKEGAGEP